MQQITEEDLKRAVEALSQLSADEIKLIRDILYLKGLKKDE